MFELGGKGSVARYRGPAIIQDLHLGPSGIDHGFDSEEHAGLQLRPFAGAAEMQHIGRFMEVPANAMATEIPHHAEAVLFHMHLNGVPDIAQSRPGRIAAMPFIMPS